MAIRNGLKYGGLYGEWQIWNFFIFKFPLLNLSIINSANMSGKPRKVMVPPINLIFKLLQTHAPVQIWLYEQVDFRIEGKIRVSRFILFFGYVANV
jgi:hypothetical protein